MSLSAHLDRFVELAFPNAQVRRLACDDKFEVRLFVEGRALAADRDREMRRIQQALRPKLNPRRKLWWGRKH